MTETELVQRLERLERDNRRLSRIGAAALVLATALSAIHATQPVPGKITARELDIMDSAGRVRASVTPDGINFRGVDGANWAAFGTLEGGAPGISIMEKGGALLVTTHMISLFHSGNAGTSTVIIGLGNDGRASVHLVDAQGFELDLGGADMALARTGERRRTSTASIVMFGNDETHKVIWQAP
jgi:hypothetical protein